MAKDLGFSLGKLNYCLKALKDKVLLKLTTFKNKKKNLLHSICFNSKGIAERTRLTVNFMKTKMKEYDDLKKELDWKCGQ